MSDNLKNITYELFIVALSALSIINLLLIFHPRLTLRYNCGKLLAGSPKISKYRYLHFGMIVVDPFKYTIRLPTKVLIIDVFIFGLQVDHGLIYIKETSSIRLIQVSCQ